MMQINFSPEVSSEKTTCIFVNQDILDCPDNIVNHFPIPEFEDCLLYQEISMPFLLIKKNDNDTPIELGGKVISAIAKHKLKNTLIVPPTSAKEHIQDFILGVQLGGYRFNHYFSEPKNPAPKETTILNLHGAEQAFEHASAISSGVHFARDLVSEPSNTLTPEEFKNRVSKLLTPLGVEVTVLSEKDILKRNMNALHGVARGSRKPPFVVAMHWKGSKDEPVAVAGKGVCFDTGGISLKPANNMHEMKYDMGGAASVAGLMYTLALRKANANVVGVIGLVENMPDGNAQNPGDVVKSMSGQTIEVLNTDAEGRLVLADVFTYVQADFKPKAIVDLATLTGAIVVSLGHEYAGLFSNNTKLAQHLVSAGMHTNERVWQLPIGPEYDKQIDSDIADMQNIGKRWAGSITAAQFIGRFVENDIPWAHLDIAGVAWADSGNPYTPKGATGFGVRLLNQWISDHHEPESS